MSTCSCRRCGPRNVKTTTVEVTITLSLTRDGWEETGFGTVWGEVESEHEVRASVTYGSVDDEPEIVWLDQAVLEDLDLDDAEMLGAHEQAAEAGYQALVARGEQADDATMRADHEADQRKDDALQEAV